MERNADSVTASPPPAPTTTGLLSVVGSLRFGTLLLMLLLVAMACATVFESINGTEQALTIFYGSRWFVALLALVVVNVAASIATRFPLTWPKVGFLLTHAGILVVAIGALVTHYAAVDGVIAVREGETASHFQIRQDALRLVNRRTGETSEVDLSDAAFSGFVQVDRPTAPVLEVGGLRTEVARYLPDSATGNQVVNDSPRPHAAIAVTFGAAGGAEPVWLFAGQTRALGPAAIGFRTAADQTELTRWLAAGAADPDASIGRISVEIAGLQRDFAVEDCLGEPVSVAGTPYRFRVLRYMPHATVGNGRQISNASDKPVNPALEIELIGAAGSEKRICFAKFPDFRMSHGQEKTEDVKLVFTATEADASTVPIDVMRGPGGDLHVRFARGGSASRLVRLTPGTPAETPWSGYVLTVHQAFDHARKQVTVEPIEPVRENRVPAIMLNLAAGGQTSTMWLQRGIPRPVTVDGVPFEAVFGDRVQPLDFALKLNSFHVRHYPGGRAPRSFESNITVTDPATGDTRTRIVSMNHPVSYAGYDLFQSSYQLGNPYSTSILSISRDPGLPVVFFGYVVTTIGMVVVLFNRLGEQRRLRRLLANRSEQ